MPEIRGGEMDLLLAVAVWALGAWLAYRWVRGQQASS
jgi:hypothetical protein